PRAWDGGSGCTSFRAPPPASRGSIRSAFPWWRWPRRRSSWANARRPTSWPAWRSSPWRSRSSAGWGFGARSPGSVPQRDPEAKALAAAGMGGLGEALHEHGAIGEHHLLRRLVVRVGRELHVSEAFGTRAAEHQRQRTRRVPAALLPRHDAIADVAQHVRRQLARAGLPAKSDGSAEFAVPHPEPVTGQARHRGAVEHPDGR